MDNMNKLLAKRTAPLFQIAIPFSHKFTADGKDLVLPTGPTAPATFCWLLNTVIMAVTAMIITCITAALAGYAQAPGVDAVAAIPPIYFKLPPRGIAKYWNDISDAAPDADFIICNIPQLAGVALTTPLLKEMQKNPRVIGVKNSSMPVQDIQMWRDEGVIVFNGPDEQL